jgi:hypothetical protein
MAIEIAKGLSFFTAIALLTAGCAPMPSRNSASQIEPRRLSALASTRGWSVSPSLAIAEIEQPNPTSVPPYASMSSGNDDWLAFKSKMQPGDSIHFIRYVAWTGAVGASELTMSDSYVIVRGDVIVAELVIGVS